MWSFYSFYVINVHMFYIIYIIINYIGTISYNMLHFMIYDLKIWQNDLQYVSQFNKENDICPNNWVANLCLDKR